MAIIDSSSAVIDGTSGNDIITAYVPVTATGLVNIDQTINAGDGNDVIYGDVRPFYSNPVAYSPEIAMALDDFNRLTPFTFENPTFSKDENPDITNSTSTSHVTFGIGNRDGQVWIAVYVRDGETMTLDIDYGRDANNTDTDTQIAIYRADTQGTGVYQINNTTLLAFNDDGAGTDVGSTSTYDSYLSYTFASEGRYLINIKEFGAGDGNVFEAIDEFLLHISLSSQWPGGAPAGNDTIYGGNGDDILYGMVGNDNLFGGAGADVLDGSSGFDNARYDQATSSVYARLDGVAGAGGEAVGDTFSSIEGIVGSAFDDIFVGSNTYGEFLFGLDGADGLYGLGGADTLDGGAGNDNLYGGTGADVLNGGSGFDNARYDSAASGVYARMDGVAGSYGEAAGDTFSLIEGIVGSAFDDIFVGSNTYGEYLFGQAGADYLYGLGGADNLDGGAGNDNLFGGVGADVLDGGADFDLARYDSASASVYVRLDGVGGTYGEAAGDTFVSIEGLVGSAFGDIVIGSANADYLFGLAGDDYLYGIGGGDTLDGGAGNDNLFGGVGGDALYGGADFDLARYDGASSAVYARLDGVAGQGGEAVGDTYVSIEGLVGSAFNDILVGSITALDYLSGQSGDDTLYGLGGNDILDGGAANDTLHGGGNNDTLTGGAGSDRFVFSTALNGTTNVDTVLDFEANVDDILLSQAIFAGIGGVLDASEFAIGTPNNSTYKIVYNPVTGELFYDSNSNGFGGETLFATVTAGTALTLADFVMVA
jgi:Ca2+-binding RTX toxin-like protein